MQSLADAFARLRPGRQIHGISAVLLPYTHEGEIDWGAFERHLVRTRRAGLDVAVNMAFSRIMIDRRDFLGESVAIVDPACHSHRSEDERWLLPYSAECGAAPDLLAGCCLHFLVG